MTAFRETEDLAALEQTRARLETALADDENWRALRQEAGPGEDAGARRARDTRLEMALAGNPAYRAWKHVSEAILALRPRDAHAPVRPSGPRPAAPAHAASATAGGDPAASELPQEIVDLIRSGASPSPVRPRREAAVARPQAEAAERSPPPPEAPPQTAPPSLAAAITRVRAAIPSVAAAANEAPRRPPPPPAARIPAAPDWEEATVTFVTRQARPPLLPAADLPADLGTDRRSPLFERLRGVQDRAGGDAEPSVQPAGAAEEAEVTILTSEDKEALRLAEERADTVRRLRNALSGD